MFDSVTNYQNYGIYVPLLKEDSNFCIDVNKDITAENWQNHFYSIHNILLDGVDDLDVLRIKVRLKFGDKVIKLTISDYWANLALWNFVIKSGNRIQPKHIHLSEGFSADDVKTYIDTHFIMDMKIDMDLKEMNRTIADALHYLSIIDRFSPVLCNTINVQDDALLAELCPEYEKLINPDFTGVELENINKVGLDVTKKVINIIKDSKKYLGHDHSFTNNFKANESINTKQYKEYTVSIGTKPDGAGGVFPHSITKNFLNGGLLRYIDYYIETSAGRTAQIQAKLNVGTSGAYARRMGLNNQGSFLNPDPDYICLSVNFIERYIKDFRTLKNHTGRIYRMRPDGFDMDPIKETDRHLIGKTIYLRSPITCQSAAEGRGICSHCCGALYRVLSNINIGKFASEDVSSQLTQRQLSAKHLMDTDAVKIIFEEIFYDFFIKDDEAIRVNDEVPFSGKLIKFNEEDICRENEDDIDPENAELNIGYNDYLTGFTLLIDGVEIEINSKEVSKFYFSKDFLNLASKKRYNDDGVIIIPISDIAKLDDPTLFYIPIINNEYSKTLNLSKEIMDKAEVTSSYDKNGIVNDLSNALLDGRISIHSTHLEILLSNQVRDIEDSMNAPNWKRPNAPHQFLPIKKSISSGPSITRAMVFENISSIFKNPSSFKKYKPSAIDYFFLEQPQKRTRNIRIEESDGNEMRLQQAIIGNW